MLFLASGAALDVEDGAVIELAGKSWTARHGAESLELTAVEEKSNGREQLQQRVEDIRREVAGRKQDMADLNVRQAELTKLIEQVRLE